MHSSRKIIMLSLLLETIQIRTFVNRFHSDQTVIILIQTSWFSDMQFIYSNFTRCWFAWILKRINMKYNFQWGRGGGYGEAILKRLIMLIAPTAILIPGPETSLTFLLKDSCKEAPGWLTQLSDSCFQFRSWSPKMGSVLSIKPA